VNGVSNIWDEKRTIDVVVGILGVSRKVVRVNYKKG
jgi:hypothetical protein